MIESNINREKGKDHYQVASDEQKEEVMCWKDPNKTCKCDRPQQGVFCVRYPTPTD